MAAAGAHASALLAAVRQGLRTYREEVAFRGADPRFAPALDAAREIEGFTSPVELALLYHLAAETEPPGCVVEIGSYLGRSTVVLARAEADRGRPPVTAVDPHTAALGFPGEEPRATDEEFRANVRRAGLEDHVRLLHATSTEGAGGWDGDPVRMLFVDGWHSEEAVIEDVSAWAPFFVPAATVVFDDYGHAGVRAGVRALRERAVVSGASLLVGKMIAFAPAAVISRVPAPPGARALSRLGDRGLDFAFRLAAPDADGSDGSP